MKLLIKTFCTYITYYGGDKLPPYYIGHSTISKVENGYRGSVSSRKYKKIYQQELLENPHLFETEILESFHTRKEAEIAESVEQIKVNADRNPKYMNKIIHCRHKHEISDKVKTNRLILLPEEDQRAIILIKRIMRAQRPISKINHEFLRSLDKEKLLELFTLAKCKKRLFEKLFLFVQRPYEDLYFKNKPKNWILPSP